MRNTVTRRKPLGPISPLMQLAPLVMIGSFVGCLEADKGPTGPGIAVAIAPLELTSISDACYNLTVTNEAGGAGEVVWSEAEVCASQYGDSQGSITYVGPCDASPDGRMNSVTLELVSLSDKTIGMLSAPTDYVNPCPVGQDRCILDVECRANADTPVTFDLTVLRNAQQGFFDVAVNFEDIFCSSKIDCTYDKDGKEPIDLLFDAEGNRNQSVVVALACTGGPGNDEGTVLHVNGPRVVCGQGASDSLELAFATTCVDTGEVFGIGASVALSSLNGPDEVRFYPVVSTPDGEGGYTTEELPYSNASITGNGGVVLGRLDDTHVGGFVLVGEAIENNSGEAHLAIWTRGANGAWALTSTVDTGGGWDFGDGFAWLADRRLLLAGIESQPSDRLVMVPVGANFELGTPWSPTPPAGTDACQPFGLSGDLLVFGCYDTQAGQVAGQNFYTVQAYDLDTFANITPPDMGLVQTGHAMCGDRIIATVYDEANTQNIITQWQRTDATWVDSTLRTQVGTDIVVEDTMTIKELDGTLSLWACEPSGGWKSAAQPATGRTYLADSAQLPYGAAASFAPYAAVAGIADGPDGRKPFIASFDLQAAVTPTTWHEESLPTPTACDGLELHIDGVAARFDRPAQLIGICSGTNQEENYTIVWELGVVDGHAAATAWRYAATNDGDLLGMVTRSGADGGLSVTSEGWPNCESLIGAASVSGPVGSSDNLDATMALWDLTGTSNGAELTPTLLPVFERSGGTPGAAAWSLTVDPTFEGNLWTDPKVDEPVFQVGSYHGQESLLCGGEPCNKVYWNVVVGFDPTIPDCRLEWEATAASAPGLTNGQTDKATVYPFLQGNVQLTSSAKDGAAASLVCRQNPLNGGGGLGTEYTTPGDTHTFCSATDGDVMWSVEGCTWTGIPVGGGNGGGDPTPVEPGGAAIDPGTIQTDGDGETVNVTVTNAFWIAETEVTIGEWKALSGGIDPSGFPGTCGTDDCPVNQVSWWSSLGYLNALSLDQGLAPCFDLTQATNCTGTWQAGSLLCDGSPFIDAATLFDCEGFRLPTEGEWELAARAGTTTETYGGNQDGDPICPKLSGAGAFLADTPLADLAWYDCNSMSSTHKVGSKAPNARGLHDMLGNVWEWVHDWYGSYAGTNLTDSIGPASGIDRIKRGGGYSTLAADVSAPGRGRADPSQRSLTTGFRAARSILTPTP